MVSGVQQACASHSMPGAVQEVEDAINATLEGAIARVESPPVVAEESCAHGGYRGALAAGGATAAAAAALAALLA